MSGANKRNGPARISRARANVLSNFLLVRAIRHPWKALIVLAAVIRDTASRGLVVREARHLRKALQTLGNQMLRTRQRKVDLMVLDTAFPHPLSPFRLEEFCSYLRHFENTVVLSTGEVLPFFQETRRLGTIISEFERRYPEFKGRTKVTTCSIDGYEAKLAYLTFLGTVIVFLESLERKKIPFVFTLYPGGAFELHQDESDRRLRRVFQSPQFRRVIVTQPISYDYLVNNKLCTKDKIELINGVVTPAETLNRCRNYRKERFGFEKNVLDICFVAHKYADRGTDKGYDVFIEVAKKLAPLHGNIRFHVVGNFGESDIPIDGLEGRINFYGLQLQRWFDKFYVDKDMILSPNVPFVLGKGSFDGFPTASCTEAGLRKVAIFCTDELKLNRCFVNNEDLMIIPHNVDGIVQAIHEFYSDPDRLRRIAESGAAKILEMYSYEKQMIPRIDILETEIRNQRQR